MAASVPKFEYDEKKKTLTIVCDLSVAGKPSASGKTTVLCTTSGNQPIQITDDTVFVGLNIYIK